jgi:hypothetical protein
MEFGVLGTLEVRGRGRVLPLGAAKQRCLLGVLLLRPNEADRGGGGKPDDPASCGAKRPCRAVRGSKMRVRAWTLTDCSPHC